MREMFPFVPAELGTDFDLERALAQGTLPLVVATDPAELRIRPLSIPATGRNRERWRNVTGGCRSARIPRAATP